MNDHISEVQERGEDWKRSIPAQVFLNYFFSMYYIIRQSAKAFDLNELAYFREGEIRSFEELNTADRNAIQQHLLNAWNTEYALRTTAELGNKAFLQNALHWTFPQAYYSVFESLQAFLRLQGLYRIQSEQIEKEAGKLIAGGAYPEAVAFYATGHPLRPRLHGLRYGSYKPSLQLADLLTESQAQVGQFLRTTRRTFAQQLRKKMQSNPATALRSQTSGSILLRFTDEHWQQLSWRIGYTTIFSFLQRLKISANHKEITRFVEADIDFHLFHQSLQCLVGYLNFIHEAYIAKAMGLESYRKWVAALPSYLQEGFVQQRLDEQIVPLLDRSKTA